MPACLFLARTALLAALFAGCDFPGFEDEEQEPTGCTEIVLNNFCVTLNGSARIPDSVRVLRVAPPYPHTDTLVSQSLRPPPEPSEGNCFDETLNPSTVKVVVGDRVLKEVQVATPRRVDACHAADTTIHLIY